MTGNEYTILQHDLNILEEMAGVIGNYLSSDVTKWTIPRANMPKLTIGGFLMRQERLQALKETLTMQDRARLAAAVHTFENSLVERVVRFENRTHQELTERMGEWMGHLREMRSRMAADKFYYPGVVDTRLVIQCMVHKLRQPPYELRPHVLAEMEKLDRILRRHWQAGDFVWEAIWQPAYPAEEFWFLYGRPEPV